MGQATVLIALVVLGLNTGNGMPVEKLIFVPKVHVLNLLKKVPMFKRQAEIKVGILFPYAQGITTSEVKN
jgi:cell shape-determining protein MreD